MDRALGSQGGVPDQGQGARLSGRKGPGFPAPELWAFLIRWICPAAIALILVVTLASML